jgi:hypothetical protein
MPGSCHALMGPFEPSESFSFVPWRAAIQRKLSVARGGRAGGFGKLRQVTEAIPIARHPSVVQSN